MLYIKFKHKLHTIQLNNIFIIRFAWTQTNRNIANKTAILSENKHSSWYYDMVDIVFASWQTFSFLLACIDFNISMDK